MRISQNIYFFLISGRIYPTNIISEIKKLKSEGYKQIINETEAALIHARTL